MKHYIACKVFQDWSLWLKRVQLCLENFILGSLSVKALLIAGKVKITLKKANFCSFPAILARASARHDFLVARV